MGNGKYDIFEKVKLNPCEQHELGKALNFFLHLFEIVDKVLNLSCQQVDNFESFFDEE